MLLVRAGGEEAKPLTDERRTAILKQNEELASEALRSLGVAFRSLPADALEIKEVDESLEQDLVFAGLLA